MTRARFTQVDVERAIRAVEKTGFKAVVEITPGGTIRIIPTDNFDVANNRALDARSGIIEKRLRAFDGRRVNLPDDGLITRDLTTRESEKPLRHKQKKGPGGYPIPDSPNDHLAQYYNELGFDSKTMNQADMERLQGEADARWRASVPGTPLNVREQKVLLQFEGHGLGVLVPHGKLKGIGCDTRERLNARGFVEIRPNPKWPDRVGGYVLTETGFEAMKALLSERSKG